MNVAVPYRQYTSRIHVKSLFAHVSLSTCAPLHAIYLIAPCITHHATQHPLHPLTPSMSSAVTVKTLSSTRVFSVTFMVYFGWTNTGKLSFRSAIVSSMTAVELRRVEESSVAFKEEEHTCRYIHTYIHYVRVNGCTHAIRTMTHIPIYVQQTHHWQITACTQTHTDAHTNRDVYTYCM